MTDRESPSLTPAKRPAGTAATLGGSDGDRSEKPGTPAVPGPGPPPKTPPTPPEKPIAPPAARQARKAAELEELSKDLTWSRPPRRTPAAPLDFAATRRMHIVLVGWEFPPHHSGGLGVHSLELCRELTRMGHRVTFLTPFTGPFTEVPGVEFRYPTGPEPGEPAASYPDTYFAGELARGSSAEAIQGWDAWVESRGGLADASVVHIHDWFGTVGGIALARRLGVPSVLTIHSTEYDRSLGHPGEAIRWREEYGVRNADITIAVSQHLARQLIDRYGALPARVRVIYNAVRPTPRLEGVEAAHRIVLCLGRLTAVKGIDTFLRAAARVAPAFPDALFVVAGQGPEYPRLIDLAVHLGIADQVVFLGHVTEPERLVLLASASVFVLPSVVEPFGIAALEAMAAGVPVILSKTSGVAEVATNVFAVDFWDVEEFASRIAELLVYPVLRGTMGEGGRDDALREGWAERTVQTVGVYAELATRARHPR
ncbi:MAG TPA: glycosyltransferase family 4 protein [Thermoplasmata archaeon]|nr:glycosyltransferase family 4 protein [Thermoplasmata archaeon]